MTSHADQLLTEALRTVRLSGSFSPAEVGQRIGLDKSGSEAAARSLSNAGVLVLGFDCSAEFSPGYRKLHAPPEPTPARKKKAVAGKNPAAKRKGRPAKAE